MALQDEIIKRLRKRGVTVVDVRGNLPRAGTWLRRPVGAIKQIAAHHDAEPRPHVYDSVQRYIAQAWYHINKDWGGGSGGDGLMYAFKIDNVGVVFITRDLEDVLWSVGDQNYVTASYCFDGTTGQGCTREQITAEQALLEVLCFECAEFPASQANALGHQEVPGNNTACPGDFLPSVRSYRAERNTHPELYNYEESPAPAPLPPSPLPTLPTTPIAVPTPPAVPAPLPEPPAPQAPAVPSVPDIPAPPVPGTIILPEPGKGSVGQPPADIPVATPPSANPAPNPTVLQPLPPPIPHDEWQPFPEGQRTLFLEQEAYAVDLAGVGAPKGPYAAGHPIISTGVLEHQGREYYAGATTYAIPVDAFEPPEPETPAAVSAIGEFIRTLGSLIRRLLPWLNRSGG